MQNRFFFWKGPNIDEKYDCILYFLENLIIHEILLNS